jgi:hypothetical protein
MSRRVRREDAVVPVKLARRRACQWLLLPAAQWLMPAPLLASTIASARLWPAQEYTRLILESGAPVAYQMFVVKNPARLVLDLDDVELTPELAQLAQHVQPDDPYIEAIRVARFKPGVLRIVLDLKSEVDPQLFALNPFGSYGHRVVLDLYPMTPLDPLMTLLEFDRSSSRRHGPTRVVEKPPPKLNDRLRRRPRPRAGGRLSSPSIPATAAVDPVQSAAAALARKTSSRYIARRLKRLIDGEPGMRAMLTRDDDSYVALECTGTEGAAGSGRSVHLVTRLRVHEADGEGFVGVRAVGAWRDQRRGALARAARERSRSDRRRQPRQPGSGSCANSARPFTDRADQR